MNWHVPFNLEKFMREDVTQPRLLHSNPTARQIYHWNTQVARYTHYRHPMVIALDGLSCKLSAFNNETMIPTKFELAWCCILLAIWPKGFDQPDLLDVAAFSAAADYSEDEYLNMYVNLITRHRHEVVEC